jgi:hypothetical protein
LITLGLLERGGAEAIAEAVERFYPEGVPPNIAEAVGRMGWFLRDGEEARPEDAKKRARALDYDVDAPLILAAFRSAYQIDLTRDSMHWWTFLALLEGLPGHTRLAEIMGYRTINLSEIKDKETRKHYAQLQKQFRLPTITRVSQPGEMVRKAAELFD